MTDQLDKLFAHIDAHQDVYVQGLREAVAIPSVSGTKTYRPQVVEMAHWLTKRLETLNVKVEHRHPGMQVLEGSEIPLPPILLGSYGADPAKKTLLVYGHYDVQPALKDDGWLHDPFTLVETESGQLLGRGSTDDKGPILGWIWALEAHQVLGLDFPVNLRFCLEGMEESGSEGLDALIYQEANKFFTGVDAVCISDNYWLGTTKPCLTYGLRGVSYFHLQVTGIAKDLHSGVFGGVVHEPMTDLTRLMAALVEVNGRIQVPGIYDSVLPVTPEETALYDVLDFSLNDIYNAIGSKTSIHDNEKGSLMARWRFPSLSLHGIEGAFYSPGAKTVIPAKVTGKFSIRTVPNQDPAVVTKLVQDFVQAEFAKLNSKNSVKVTCDHAGKWWVADPKSWNYTAAAKAVKRVFGVEPDYTREGGSIPVTLTFQEALKKSVLLLPMGRADDGAHSINEKLDRSNYISGIKLLTTYIHEISAAQMDV